MLTRPMLQTLWPRAKPEKIDSIIQVAPEVFKKYEINTPLRLAHLMAQISHENGAGTIVRENMNYRAERLVQVFGGKSAYVTKEEAKRLAHRPEAIAERVYGLGCPAKAKDLGNILPGDGWRYRGNGDLQLTGRENHARIGRMIGYDLEGNPEQLENPAISFWCAVAEFAALHCISAADADNVELVTKRVNGGTNGLADRRTWTHKWKVAIEAENTQVAEAPAEQIDEALQADAMPRGAEVKAPPVAPEVGGGAAIGGGTGLAVEKSIFETFGDYLAPLRHYSKYVETICLILILAGLGYAAWARFQQSKSSRSR